MTRCQFSFSYSKTRMSQRWHKIEIDFTFVTSQKLTKILRNWLLDLTRMILKSNRKKALWISSFPQIKLHPLPRYVNSLYDLSFNWKCTCQLHKLDLNQKRYSEQGDSQEGSQSACNAFQLSFCGNLLQSWWSINYDFFLIYKRK